MHTHELVSWRLAGSGDDTHLSGHVKVAIDQFEQAEFMQDAEGVAIEGAWVVQVLLSCGMIPVGATQEDARIGEARDVASSALHGCASIMIEMSVSYDQVGNVFWTN